LDYQAANAIGYASGTLLSFILNARFNFRVSDRIVQRLVCFFGVALLGWSISAGLLYEFIGNWHCNKYLSKLGTLVVVVLVQFNLNRWFSFRKSDH
jgi:putative flippase GtrA